MGIRMWFNFWFAVVVLVVVAALTIHCARRKGLGLGSVHLLAVWMMAAYPAFITLYQGELDTEFFGISIQDHHVFWSLASILVWTVVFYYAYSHDGGPKNWVPKWVEGLWMGRKEWIVLLCAAIAGLTFLTIIGAFGVTTRAGFEGLGDDTKVATVVEAHLVLYPARFAPYIALVFLCSLVFSDKKTLTRLTIIGIGLPLLIISSLVNNLLANSRSVTGFISLAFLYIIFFRKNRNGYPALLSFFVAVFVIFPLDFGRTAGSFADALTDLNYSIETIAAGDIFRTFESIPTSIAYVEEAGSTAGSQLFGNLLFFIPREWWPDKSIGTGAFLAQYSGAVFTNVACTLQCEAIVNFGFLGVPLFAYGYARILRAIDNLYSLMVSKGEPNLHLIQVIYPFLHGLVFFMTRGDLLSPLAITASLALVLVPVAAVSLLYEVQR